MPLALRSFVERGEDLATTGIILMGLVAGATAAEDAEAICDTVLEYPVLHLIGCQPPPQRPRLRRDRAHTELRVEPIAAA